MAAQAATSAAPRVRPSATGDLPAITEIYAHHVRHGLASFEETPPDVAEMTRRRAAVLAAGYRYLVAERDGRVVGYAHAAPYRTRPAYRNSVETTVYVAPDGMRRGVGRALLAALIEICTAEGYRQMVAVVGDTGNDASIGLNEALGFARVGRLRAIGFKFGRWVDSVILQRALGDGDETPP